MSKVTIYSPPATAQIKHCAVDFDLRREPVPIHLVQYDKTLPILEVSLYKGSVPYRLPDDAEANVRMGKRNNLIVYNPVLGCGENRDRVYIAITPQMTTQEGIFYPIVEVLVDGGLAGTSPMQLVVDRNPAQEDAIEDSSEGKSLEELVKQAAASAESARNDAEIAKQAEQTVEANAGNIQAVVDNLDAIKAAPGQAKAAAASAAAAQQAAQEALGFRTFFSAITPDANGDLDPSRPMTTPSAASVTVKSKGDRIQSVQVNGFTTQAGTGDPSPDNVREISTAGLRMVAITFDGSEDENWVAYLGATGVFYIDTAPAPLSFQAGGAYCNRLSFANPSPTSNLTSDQFTYQVRSGAVRIVIRVDDISTDPSTCKQNLQASPLTFWYVPADKSQATGLYIPIQAQGHEYRCEMLELTAPLCDGDKVESCVPSGCDKSIVFDGSSDETWRAYSGAPGVFFTDVDAQVSSQNFVAYTRTRTRVTNEIGISANNFFVQFPSGKLRVAICIGGISTDPEDCKDALQANPEKLFYRSASYTEANDISVQLETHNRNIQVYNGTESWGGYGTSASVVNHKAYKLVTPNTVASQTGGNQVVCTVAPTVDSATAYSKDANGVVSFASGNIVLQLPTEIAGNLSAFKEYLAAQYAAGTPVTVVYELATTAVYAHDPVTLVAVPYTQADVDAANQLASRPSMLPNIDSPDVPMLLDAANNAESAAVQTMAIAENAVPVAGTYVVSSQDGTTVALYLKAMQDGGDAATLGGMTLDEIKQLISDAVTAAVQMAQA